MGTVWRSGRGKGRGICAPHQLMRKQTAGEESFTQMGVISRFCQEVKVVLLLFCFFCLFVFCLFGMKTKSTTYFIKIIQLFLVIRKPITQNIALSKCIKVANYFYFAWVYKLLNVSSFSIKCHVNAIILPQFPEPYIRYYLAFRVVNLKQKSGFKQYCAENQHLAWMPTASGLFSDSLDVYIF